MATSPLTFLQVKNLLNHYISSKPHTSDSRVAQTINFAVQKLQESGFWRNSLFVTTLSHTAGTLTLPPEVQSIVRLLDETTCPKTAPLQTIFYPFSPNAHHGKCLRQLIPNGDDTYQISPTPPIGTAFKCLVTRSFVPLVDDADLVYPSNPNALRNAVQAVVYEDANDLERAKVYWDQAYLALQKEQEKVQVGEQPSLEVNLQAFTRFPNLI